MALGYIAKTILIELVLLEDSLLLASLATPVAKNLSIMMQCLLKNRMIGPSI